MTSVGSALASWFTEVRMQVPSIFAGQSYNFPVVEGSVTVSTRAALRYSRGTRTRAICSSTNIEFDIHRLRLGAKAGHLVTLDMLEAFEREADVALSAGSHPNIVRCFGSLIENAGVEHCRLLLCDPCGSDLEEYLRTHGGALPIGDVAELGEQLSLGLRHLHGLSILCGGVTTHGVLLGCDGKWKLLGDLTPAAVLPLQATEWRHCLLSHASKEQFLLPPEVRSRTASDDQTVVSVSLALDIWMLGAMLAQVCDGVDSTCISSARTGNAILAASQNLLLCPFATRFWMLLHWLLATEPSQRPSSRRLVDILHSLEEISPQDLLIEMPEHARFHCEGMVTAAARKLAYSSFATMGSNRTCAVGLPLEILRMSMADPSAVDQLYQNSGLEIAELPVADEGQPEVPTLVPIPCQPDKDPCGSDDDCINEDKKPRSRSSSVCGLDTDESTDAGSTSEEDSTNVSDTDSAGDGFVINQKILRAPRQRRPMYPIDS